MSKVAYCAQVLRTVRHRVPRRVYPNAAKRNTLCINALSL